MRAWVQRVSTLIIFGLAASCGDEGPSRDARYAQLEASVAGWPIPASDTPADTATWIGGTGLFSATSTGVSLRTTTTRRVFPGRRGRFTAALAVDRGTLVGTTEGLFTHSGDWLDPSPIGADLEGGVVDLARTRGSVWISTTQALFRWSGGQLDRVQVAGADLVDARLAARGAELIAVSEGAAWLLSNEGRSVERLAGPEGAIDAALTPSGERWVLDATQRAWWAPPGVPLAPITARIRIQGLAAGPTGLWLQDDAGDLIRVREGTLQPLTGARGQLLGSGGDGAALLSLSNGVTRVFSALTAELAGLPAGPIDRPVEVEIRPLYPDLVATVDAELGGVPTSVSARPWRVTLDPGGLPPGAAELVVRVTYSDDKPAFELRKAVSLSGGAPTWSSAVGPISERSCALCHGASGNARDLSNREAWMGAFELIIENIRAGRMPLPPGAPLGAAEVGLLEAWGAAGFPE